ncbi:unnamed protein product [Gadus morhua 'NCC']
MKQEERGAKDMKRRSRRKGSQIEETMQEDRGAKTPLHSDNTQQRCNSLISFFKSKVDNIRSLLSIPPALPTLQPPSFPAFPSLQPPCSLCFPAPTPSSPQPHCPSCISSQIHQPSVSTSPSD